MRQEDYVWDIQGKNPVIEIVPDEVIGKDMRGNVDQSMKPTSDVTWGDSKGEARKIILYNLSCKKIERALALQSESVHFFSPMPLIPWVFLDPLGLDPGRNL